jgi:hypothetical protein
MCAVPADAETVARSYRTRLRTGMEAPFILGILLDHGAPKVDRDSEEAQVRYRVVHRHGNSHVAVSRAALPHQPERAR